eukprot:s1807_g3.t1
MALPAMDSKEIMEHFNRLDNEEKVMVLGAVVCATVLVVYIARSLGSICGGLPSEEDALKQAMPVLSVRLSRFGNEKLGLCLRSEGSYATITGWELICDSDAPVTCCDNILFSIKEQYACTL